MLHPRWGARRTSFHGRISVERESACCPDIDEVGGDRLTLRAGKPSAAEHDRVAKHDRVANCEHEADERDQPCRRHRCGWSASESLQAHAGDDRGQEKAGGKHSES